MRSLEEQKEHDKKLLLKELTDEITSNINDLVKEKQKQIDENGKKKAIKDIATDLGISNQALANYTTDRLPEYKQLAFIQQYFNVPYANIFGEVSNKNKENVNLGMLLGLSDNAISILKDIKKSESDDDAMLLFTINLLIENKELARHVARLIISKISSEHDRKGIYEYMLFDFQRHTDNFINKMVQKENIPTIFIKKAQKRHRGEIDKKEIDNFLNEYNSLDNRE